MKKKLLIGLIAGSAVFAAVFGAAATLGGSTGIQDQSLGANNASVTACDDNGVKTSYTTAWDDTDKRFEVTSVTVSDIAATCALKNIAVQLMSGTAADTVVTGATGSSTLGAAEGWTGTHTLTLGTAASAKDVTGVHVVING
ncbi:MAG TPA: hypothetical protein VG929_07840 [Actinomycetota bacterium]|nr:hypothetical protein [Actinomycetota bacterium]